MIQEHTDIITVVALGRKISVTSFPWASRTGRESGTIASSMDLHRTAYWVWLIEFPKKLTFVTKTTPGRIFQREQKWVESRYFCVNTRTVARFLCTLRRDKEAQPIRHRIIDYPDVPFELRQVRLASCPEPRDEGLEDEGCETSRSTCDESNEV